MIEKFNKHRNLLKENWSQPIIGDTYEMEIDIRQGVNSGKILKAEVELMTYGDDGVSVKVIKDLTPELGVLKIGETIRTGRPGFKRDFKKI